MLTSIRTSIPWPQALLLTFLTVLFIYTVSGTLTPYAASHHTPLVEKTCNYLQNIDHPHFEATYKFIDGQPRAQWSFSVLLRRILYPLITYPAMRLFGFELGGLLVNMCLHVGAILFLVAWARRELGVRASWYIGLLALSFPGLGYFASVPYCYASIFPCSIICFILLSNLERSLSSQQSLTTQSTSMITPARTSDRSISLHILICALFLGIVFVAYDLFFFFGGGLFLLLLYKRRWILAPCTFALCVLPSISTSLALEKWGGVPSLNANTKAYRFILLSYLSIPDFSKWSVLLLDVPRIFVHNFFYAGFVFLPTLWIVALLMAPRRGLRSMPIIERCILVSALAVWLFNNLAPPYEGWQLRGDWIARLYEPIFIVFLVSSVRALTYFSQRWVLPLISVVFLLQATVFFGPLVGFTSLSDHLYYNFYRHSYAGAFTENIQKYGARPMGWCLPR
jgi:hypothetical protein